MSQTYDEILKEITKEYFYTKEYLSKEEFRKMTLEGQNPGDQGFEYFDEEKDQWYKKIIGTPTPEEMNVLVNVKLFKKLDQLNDKVSTIKGILIFWLILSILSLCIWILGASR